jgi:hypothetical protein
LKYSKCSRSEVIPHRSAAVQKSCNMPAGPQQ